jgi:uncharacterized protein (UPF0332 family)
MTKEIMGKAAKALASARILLDAGDSDGATNRAYYAMFDAATAALSWAGVGAEQNQHRTHGRLIRSFGLHLARTGRLPAELGRSLNRVQELRLIGDYLAEPVPLEKARWAVQEADTFVVGIQRLLTQPKA